MEGRGWGFLETEEGSLAGQLTVSTQRPSLGTRCVLPQQPEQRQRIRHTSHFHGASGLPVPNSISKSSYRGRQEYHVPGK